MYNAFKGTKNLLRRPKKIDKPRPDNFVFRLHYQFTFGILAICCLMVTSYQYIDSSGSAIQCMLDKGVGVGGGLLNKYCWIMSTFTLPKHWEGEQGVDFIHHGVGPEEEGEDERVYHAYYQWVPLMLSFQAAMFYLPHWIWKQLEGGRLKCIVAGLHKEDDEAKTKAEVDNCADYMRLRLKDQWDHKVWAAKFYFCEILNLVNVIFQMILTDIFLGGSFSKYGVEAASWSNLEPENRVDPMSRVFPRMTKCHFHKFGPSGSVQKFDALCVLGMNIINEKIFVFLWFWYWVLAVATACNVIWRLATLMIPNLRSRMVVMEELGFRNVDDSQREKTEQCVANMTYPDWLILYYLAQCCEKKNFSRLIKRMLEDQPEDDEIQTEDDSNDGSTLRSRASLLKSYLPGRKSDV